MYVWCKIVGRPGWWVILLFILFVNFIIGIILCIDLAKSFGKGVSFGIGLILLSVIFFTVLGFGSGQYQGPAAGSMAGPAMSRPPQTAKASAAKSGESRSTKVERVVPNPLTGSDANRLRTMGSTFRFAATLPSSAYAFR